MRGPTDVIVERARPVELVNHVALAERGSRRVELLPVLRHGRPDPRALELDRRVARAASRPGGIRSMRLAVPRRTELVEALAVEGRLPAIVLIISRAACDDAVDHCLADGLRLADPDQRAEIRRRCEEHTEGLSDADLRVLDYGRWISGLESGVAAHHAGMIPAFREAVEDCFSAGLLQAVFATETLALGINMPARTVVIDRLTKVREHGRSGLTSGEFAQLTGRAGRRGLDTVGHAVVPWAPHVSMAEVASLATSPAPDLRSSFRPTYNLAVNLVRRYPVDRAHHVLDHSFAQFLDRRHHHALSERLDRTLALLEARGHVDVGAWRLRSRGEVLARIYHESDLLVAEALLDGLFDGLDPPALAAVVSACTFQVRPGRWRAEARPPHQVSGRLGALEHLAEDLREQEEGSRLGRTRAPDHGFAGPVWRWARGQALERVLERAELAPGDFVRNAKQLVDLLRQLASIAPVPATGAAADAAARAVVRGVVAASAALPWAEGGGAGEDDGAGAGEGRDAGGDDGGTDPSRGA